MTIIRTIVSAFRRIPPLIRISVGAVLVLLILAGWYIRRPLPESARTPESTNAPDTAIVHGTTAIVFENRLESHACTQKLNLTLGDKVYNLTANPYAARGVPEGPQLYTVDGLISCPGKQPTRASGSGVIDVREGAVFGIKWQNKSGDTGVVEVFEAGPPPQFDIDERVGEPASSGAVTHPASKSKGSSPEKPGQEGATPGKSKPEQPEP